LGCVLVEVIGTDLFSLSMPLFSLDSRLILFCS
jgi:hypothetical protein